MPSAGRLRPVLLVAAIALVAGVVAWWMRPPPVAPPDPELIALERPSAPSTGRTPLPSPTEPTGGVFAGVVVDSRGDPVRDADVFLAGKLNTTKKIPNPIVSNDPTAQATPDLEIQQIDYVTVAAVKTDKEGRFRAAAGDSTIVALFAIERSKAPGISATNPPGNAMKPGADHRIVLPEPGWLKGKVIDAVTKEPVRGADVALNLQTRASQGDVPGPEPWTERNGFSAFQTYVARELAPRVWDAVPLQNDPSIHRYTQSDGTFTFGPVMNEVQIDVVVTHPDYAWTDFDEEIFYESDNKTRKEGEKKVARKRRIAIPPGKTVEKTYPLIKGEEIRGRVEDPQGNPIPDVEIALDHVAQYAQHAWYRDHARIARSGDDGRFRIAGLSYAPYNLHMSHPAFGSADFHGVLAGSDQPYQITQAGWIEGEVEGGVVDRPLYEAMLRLDPYTGHVKQGRMPVTVKDGKFTAKNVDPGRYAVSLTVGVWTSTPIDVVVESGKPASYHARLETGGTIALSAVDAKGAVIDPMSAELEIVGTDGRSLRGAGGIVGRKGVATANALTPGRYRARVRAPWYLEAVTEPFDVAADKTTSVGPVVLHKQGWIRIQSLKDETGQAPTDVMINLSIAHGGSDFVPTRTGDAGLIPVNPGTVKVRAQTNDGRSFEQTYEVGEGETVPVDVRISK